MGDIYRGYFPASIEKRDVSPDFWINPRIAWYGLVRVEEMEVIVDTQSVDAKIAAFRRQGVWSWLLLSAPMIRLGRWVNPLGVAQMDAGGPMIFGDAEGSSNVV
jgi:hypothetical protein